jgi:hypothetical protein
MSSTKLRGCGGSVMMPVENKPGKIKGCYDRRAVIKNDNGFGRKTGAGVLGECETFHAARVAKVSTSACAHHPAHAAPVAANAGNRIEVDKCVAAAQPHYIARLGIAHQVFS